MTFTGFVSMDSSGISLHWSDPHLRLRVGSCFRTRTEPGWSAGLAWSRRLRDFDLWVITGGRGRLRYRGLPEPDGQVDLRPGTALLLRPGGVYEATSQRGHPLIVDAVHFDVVDAGGSRPPGLTLPPLALTVPDSGFAEASTRRLRERAVEGSLTGSGPGPVDDPVAAAVLRALLLDLEDVTTAGVDPAGAGERLHRRVTVQAEARIRERLGDPPTVAELAAEAGFSADHFGRVFRKISGRSPQRALIQARTERAAQLLRTTPMTVSEIAAALGYRDIHFFSRQFKQETGHAPSTYRRGEAGGS